MIAEIELPSLEDIDAEIQRRETDKCRQDKVYFINTLKTFDPRLPPGEREIPFVLWQKQIEYIHWLDYICSIRENGDVSKTRDGGVTWLTCAYFLHGFVFEDEFTGGFGSRKLELVDHLGDPKCIFHKIRFMLYRLPVWMRPKNIIDAYCRLVNNDNGSTIIGEGGIEIGRGGRTKIYAVDESDYLADQEGTEAALSANTDTVVNISTHRGIGTRFYERVFSGKGNLFTFDWWDDPRKDKEWYEKKKASMPTSSFAREIERDPNNADPDALIRGEWIRAATQLEEFVRAKYEAEGQEFTLDLFGTKKEAGLDVADGGEDTSDYICRQGARVLRIETWHTPNVVTTAYKARELAKQDAVSVLKYDAIGVGAGVSGAYALIDKLEFRQEGIKGSHAASNAKFFDDQPSIRASERFKNKRAEIYWSLRRRFEKTYHYINGVAEYPLDELICLPQHQTLINELSIIKLKYAEGGKIQIESKQDMKKRGIASPNKADALCYCFADARAEIFIW